MSLSGLIIICVSIGFLAQHEAATFIALPNKNPDHPGKCWDSEHNVTWSIGESITVGECIRLTCHEDLSYSGASCSPKSVVVDGFECKDLPMDLSRNYPDCCPKLQCVGEDGQIIVF
ncbi:uncharacterized protein LOC129800016 [Phlebotomus papatasi]|uniref:Single domain-containing protein n=1 Tax=Phlebotomus papatasi TaxID=29031 RepID=A0A1B0D7V4_PHLPP|nr:uncharacterized protein LOC129800016 [Phlebotomus papatasi]